MFMAAIETSIISLALPTIKINLHAGNLVSLVFTVYFIALVIANPIVGELLSRFKILYIAVAGVSLFAIGSLMSGLSETFTFFNYLKNDSRFWGRGHDVFISDSP